MIAIRPRGGWVRPVVAACVVMTVTSGCGLSAELDRERDPARTAIPSAVGTDGSGALRIEPPQLPSSVPSPATSSSPSRVVPGQQGGGCPASGLRFGTGPVDAAMGLRGMTLTLTNCGKRPYALDGYPDVVAVLGPEGTRVGGVRAVAGTDQVPMAPPDPGPKAFVLRPGEHARAGLYWRMAAEEGSYLRVAPRTGQAAVTLPLPDPLDIGPRNTLGATAWVPAG
ncbi:DUF4232 domain-containing protein [Streptomyces sp. NBC_01281]|uniref:DUF4232 domain-containing protein n=1 Tax=Streptomyces sp. NBC_01281 TaxID=2903811 RepID=UPI002E157771|nr:DUF4232 domain-containing protein [Streptomyces sp. NBC_01281]